MFHIREDFNTSRHFEDFDKVHLRFVTPLFILASLTVESSAFEGNTRLGSARIKWPLSHSKSISTGMMMVLKILTKQFVSFTNDNDFLVSCPQGSENIKPGKTSCCKSSCVCNAVVGQGSRPHFLVR